MSLQIVHVELRQANAFVRRLHRHHRPVVGHRFSVGVEKDGQLVGVCIVGRPVARGTDYRQILEVTRLCTDGTTNACSILYAASARAGKALGYKSIQTFILDSESGTSLRASGWRMVGRTPGGDGWQSREGRRDDQPTDPKTKWAKDLT